MPDPHHKFTAPPEMTREEVRKLANRASIEAAETRAKTNDMIDRSHDLLKRVDKLLAKRW